MAGAADIGFGAPGECGEAGVAEAQHFQAAQAFFGDGQAIFADLRFGVDDLADAVEKPWVKFGDGTDVVVAQAMAHGLGDDAHTVGRGLGERFFDCGHIRRAGDVDFVKASEACFQRRQRLLHGFVEGAANGHGLAHGFHRGGQQRFGAGEFLEGEARNFGDDIVNGWLERGGGDFGDVIVQLIERVAHGEFGGDLGDGEACGLGGQSRGARDAGVHLDHHHAAIGRVDCPLHVGATGFDADFAQNGNRAVPHDLVFFVGQGEGGGDSDRIAGVHAHWIDVFDRAHDDGVIGLVAHHLHLEFFPAQERLVDEDLAHGGGIHAGAAVMLVILAVIGHPAACAAHGEGGADDGGQADIFQLCQCKPHAFFQVAFAIREFGGGDDGGAGIFKTDPVHRFAEEFAVFGHFDGRAIGTDQFDVEFLQDAHIRQ